MIPILNVIIGIITMLFVLFAVISQLFFKKDNAIEQMGEQVLKHHTGLDLDFSP
jgi:hypothetical protein